MAAPKQTNNKLTTVLKRTSQGRGKPKLSSMSKNQKNSHKAYRGQGR